MCQGATRRWPCPSRRISPCLGVFRVTGPARGRPAEPGWASPWKYRASGSGGLARVSCLPRERLPVFFSKRQRRCTILCAMYCSASLCAGPALQPAVAPWRTFQFAGKLHALGRIRRSSGPAPRQVVVRGPHARTPVSLAYVYILASLARAPRRPWEFSAPRPGPRIPIFFNPRSTHARGLSRDTSCRRSCSGRALSILLARSFSP